MLYLLTRLSILVNRKLDLYQKQAELMLLAAPLTSCVLQAEAHSDADAESIYCASMMIAARTVQFHILPSQVFIAPTKYLTNNKWAIKFGKII